MTSQRADVELRLPADSAFVSVLRTAAAGMAARMDFPLDDIEDLRIAVNEASSMLLPHADADSDLWCGFFMGQGELTVSVRASCTDPQVPSRESFSWQVLSALTSAADAEAGENSLTVRLTVGSAAAG